MSPNSLWLTPFLLSLSVVVISLLFVIPLGILFGYIQARKKYWGKTSVDVLLLLPLILPPSVVGYYLLLFFGRAGPIGSILEEFFGLRLVFSFWGAVLAATVVAFPMMVKGSEAVFARIDKDIEEAAQLDGLSALGIFWSITLPLSTRGLLATIVLTAGRALGEFGATLMFAGNVKGQSNTLPLEIYHALLLNEEERATILALLLTLISASVALLFAKFRPKN